jgi:phytoene dehydrogenase-like protein
MTIAGEQNYDVIVVGAGLSGLATASLLAQKGKRVLVLERHSLAGGYATNFEREGFTFDASLHSFNGMCEGADSYELLKACGVANQVDFLPHPFLYRFVDDDVDMTVGERDIAQFERQLGEMFPSERDGLSRMFKEARATHKQIGKVFTSNWPVPLRVLSMPFVFGKVLRYEHDTVERFFSRFIGDPRLKDLLSVQWSYYGLPPDRLNFPYFCYPFIDYLHHGGYSIKGGSQVLSDALVDVIERHGGRVLLTTPVKKVLVANGRVVGVEAKRLGSVFAPKVVSNISPIAMVSLVGEQHFGGKYLNQLKSMRTAISGLQVYLGLDCPLSELGVRDDEYIIFVGRKNSLSDQYEALQANDLEHGRTAFSINLFSSVDPSLAPLGMSTLGLFTLCGGQYWHDLPRDQYEIRKAEVTATLIERAEAMLPGLSSHIKVCETGTPRTMTRYTSNPAGSFYGFEQSVDQAGLLKRFGQKYPIKGLYQVGAWTFPGAGYIGALMSAKFLSDRFF